MEWVETTGRTVEEAVEAALDRLGVAESDVEVVVVEEPRSGMFGLRRSDARIRARVRPVQPRAKRPSRRSSSGAPNGERAGRRQGARSEGAIRKPTDGAQGDGSRSKAAGPSGARANPGGPGRQAKAKGPGQNVSPVQGAGAERRAADIEGAEDANSSAQSRQRSRSRGRGGRGRSSRSHDGFADETATPGREGESPKEGRMSIETQQELAGSFVKEVVARFGIEATTKVRRTEDDGIHVSVEGDNLGLLVGPKGATVEALQELTRTVVQRHSEEHTNRIVVDVGGYRERRAAALRQFVIEAAGDVLRTGEPEALEPMSPSDRKVVHDTVNELEGLETTSEGVEPRRYVLIRRAASSSVAPTGGGPEDAGDPALEESPDPN